LFNCFFNLVNDGGPGLRRLLFARILTKIFTKMIVIANKRKNPEALKKEYPGAVIIDVTSKATDEFVKLSPFYPHLYIPVPNSDGWMGASVEGIWQGMKVFEKCDVDIRCMGNRTMKDIKRSTKRFGNCLGHRRGVKEGDLMDYLTARLELYVPCYNWVLENRCQKLVERIAEMAEEQTVVLLDYETNDDPYNTAKPLSHASLIKSFIENKGKENEL